MAIFRHVDTSQDLHVYRYNNGIKLIKPNEDMCLISKSIHNTGHTIDSIFQLPLSVYFILANSINANVNEQDALLCGFDSSKAAVGKMCFSEFTNESAEISIQNDRYVMLNERAKISEEDVVMSKGGIHSPTLSIKMPWYNYDNKVIGIFGCSIILNKHPLAESLAIVSNLGLLNKAENPTNYIGTEINRQYLSKKQTICAKLLLSGLSYKEIAANMQLSNRTVEAYINKLREKLKCRNKSELIIKLTELF